MYMMELVIMLMVPTVGGQQGRHEHGTALMYHRMMHPTLSKYMKASMKKLIR